MLRNIISKKAPILIIQIFATISLLIGQFPLTVWADSTKATRSEVPVLLASPPKKQQAIFHDGLINSPRAQDPKYKITTNLGAFKKSPNLQAVTINLQAQGLIKAQTQWHFKISDYAVNFDQKKLQLPAGITARKMGTGHLILTVHKDLRISKQRGVEISLPVKAVTGNYPLYFAIEYGHSPVRLKTTSLGVLSLGGTLAHFKPQHQTQQLAHALKKDQNQEKQTITRKNARKAKPIQVHHSMAAKDSAKQLIDNQQTLASMKSVTKTPELRNQPHENNTNDSIFNSNITQHALGPKAEINNSDEGIKIHAENTQTHDLVTKLNDDAISTQDVTPEFAAYYDKDGTEIPYPNPEATVRVDEKGNGTLAVKKTGWYILHQTNNYPASSGWTYLIRNMDGTYTHGEDGNYYAVYYDANTNKITQSMSGATRQLLPVYAADVTKLFNKRIQDTAGSSEWIKALSYINQNGGAVTFYGNGDLTDQLPKIVSSKPSSYYSGRMGTGIASFWSNSTENQRYKYGTWLIDAMQGYGCLQHPLPQNIDTSKVPLPLSTIGQNGAKDTALTKDHKSGTTQDGVITYTNDYSNNNEQNLVFRNNAAKITKIAAGSSKNLAGAKFKVWYSGSQGNGDPSPADKVGLNMVNNTPKLETTPTTIHEGSLFNYNLEGWYIIQESQAPQGYGLNGNYYAVYLDGSGFTKLMQYSSNDSSKGPVAALPSNYTAGVNITDSLIDCSYIDGDADAIAKWNKGASTKDGFITIKAGKIIFADRFNGINKIDADLPDKTLSGTTFKIWDSGADGSGVFNKDNNLKLLGSTTATNKNGQTLFSAIQNRGWYIIQEETSPEGYNRNELYYAIYYDPANGIIGLMKHASRQLLPVYATDVTELFNKRIQDTAGSSEWIKALSYINQNGGAVTFYGNGDLTDQLPKIVSSKQYSYYSGRMGTGIASFWSNSTENQRYKYGTWLIDAMQGYDCLHHSLPKDIDTTKTPLALSTVNQNLVKLPYADKNDYNSPYRKGVTSNDGFLTAKNGSLYIRNIPSTYLTLDNNNPSVVKLSDLQKGKIIWKGLWHDLNCLPTNDKTAYVTMSVDGQDPSQITKPSKAAKTGTDEYGQNDFQVTFKDDDSKPNALNESEGQVGLKTNDDSSLGEHTLAFQAHGTANSRIIKKKIIVISDDYPYETKINKYFTVNSNPYPYKRAVLSDFKSGIGDEVTVYTKIKNIGNNLYNGKLTTIIPEQFAYIQPDDNLISLKAEDGSTISVQSKYDGRTLTINLPDLKKSDQYTLSYKMKQIAPMPLSYPGPSGGASAMDHLNADSHDEQNPFYGANSNLVQWFSDQISWVKLVHVPPLEFGEHLLIKNYVGMYLNNMATTKEPNENYFQLHDTGYLGSNTWQLTAQLSNWSKNDSKESDQILPESKIRYQDDSSNFSKTLISGGAPIILLERSGGKLPSADIIQNLNTVQLYVGSKNPQAGRYHSTVTYTLTQSLE